ncbi:hypothetical protein PG911_07375 [Tenacibaculum ovolyticum]|uniref:hypothetical protein n=1 Tax=Tenacibaculum ovolyticum TaxID=104270 RepID=UPI0022F3B3A5|nr:hypothetical protein [Tenacibaculum ovolyticum]WBX78067.1 hypothetical protein PG911_07375 [Tenacibaculum ovolyticum]
MKTRKNKLTNFLKTGILLFCISLSLWNCEKQDDYLDLEQNSEYINNSRDYFNSLSLTEHQKELISTSKDIDWNNHKIFKDNNSTIIEVFLTPKNSTLLKTDKNSIINFHNRIVFVFEAEKSVEYYFTTVLSSSNQLEFISNKENINYSKVSDKFSGTIFIENKEGKYFVNKYINGMLQNKTSNNLYAKVTGDCYIVVESFSDGSTRNVPGSRFCFWTTNENTYKIGYNGGGNNSADDKIDSSELTDKAKCINGKLTKNGNAFVKDILKKFQGDSKFDINIKSVDKIFRTNTTIELNGKTKHTPGSSLINIEISTNKLSDMPALAAARTLIHEYIHADMYRKINTTNYNGDLNFKTTYEKYKQGEFKATPQHNTMADLYVNSMRDALKDFHKNVLTVDYNKFVDYFGSSPSDTFYESLAWQGLKDANVEAYNNLSNPKKTALNNEADKIGLLTKNCPN